MRKKLLQCSLPVIIFFLLLGATLEAQVQDSQWYVKDGKGWNGDTNLNSNQIQNQLTIKGIDFSNGTDKSDFFILFQDGSHFNSRYDENNIWFVSDSLISFAASSDIKYFYYTNVYDVEPPPTGIKAYDPGQNGTILSNTVSPSTTQNGIYANHNVVYGKDITLIIKLDSVKTDDNVIVDFEQLLIKKPTGSIITLNSVSTNFALQPVFIGNGSQEFAAYPLNVIGQQSQNKVRLRYNSTELVYSYLNLRPSNLPTPTALEEHREIDFDPLLDTLFAKFVLIHNQDTFELIEPVLYAFDPNYINVISVCTECREKYVLFRGNFFNGTEVEADNLAFSFELPNDSSLDTVLTFTEITVNGQELNPDDCSISFDANLNRIMVIFPDVVKIPDDRYTSSHLNGHVNFSFYMQVKETDSQNDIQTLNLDLDSLKTYFYYNTKKRLEFDLNFADVSWQQLTGKPDSLVFDSLRVLVSNCPGLELQCSEFDISQVFKKYWWAILLGLAGLIFVGMRRKRLR